MKRISLDLVFPPRPPLGRFCLAIGGAALILALVLQAYLAHALEESDAREAGLSRRLHGLKVESTPSAPADESRQRRYWAAATELGVPWEAMFRALEETRAEAQSKGRSDPVNMQTIEPDAHAGIVLLSGEVQRFEDAADYVNRLRRRPPLTDVFMLAHTENTTRPETTVHFVIQARWRPQ
jgi:hypothetical protein